MGAYLTTLVAEKNAHYPDQDAELLACGILATIAALEQTTGHPPAIGSRMAGLTLVFARHFTGWPSMPS